MVPPWLLEHCARLQQNDPELMNLNLNIRRCDTEMLEVLAVAIRQNTVLHTLNLTSSLTKASILPLITVLHYHPSLKILHLSYNRISNCNNEIVSLARAIGATNRSLTELYLDHNDIDAEGAIALANMLKENETLQVLQLSSNHVHDEGARAFAQALANNTTLKRLMLERNQITSRGVESLLQAMESNVTIQHLQVDKHQTTVHQELKFALETNRAGRRLLRQQHNVPLGLWSHVLGRSSKQADMIYYFLKELPNLCRRQNR